MMRKRAGIVVIAEDVSILRMDVYTVLYNRDFTEIDMFNHIHTSL